MNPIEIQWNGKDWKVTQGKYGIEVTCKQAFTPKEYSEFFAEKVFPLITASVQSKN